MTVETNPQYMKDLPRPVKSKVHITERIRDDCILLFHGIGHRSKWLEDGRWGYRDGDLIPQKDPNVAKNMTQQVWAGLKMSMSEL